MKYNLLRGRLKTLKTLENLKSHSGLRGIYGEQITPQLAYLLTQAYISTFNVKEIIIGRDTRPSG
ncbi:MAG: phosphoglucosamine mutase, partial [Candidatus Verstraetearchaeota archaeon]|nr:phosphoglucosamine mutase [Candidatus Verstraetearchaeota archaeon]